MLHALGTDCRYALRWLLRSPGFTAIAIASLSLGIGFNTALFSIVDALLLRPLPVERPDRIVDVYTRGGDGDRYATSSYPDFLDLRAQNGVFADMVAFSPAFAAVRTGDESRMSLSEVVTGNYFQVLGIRAAVGRTLLPDDDRPGAPRVVVISDRLWTRDYGRRGDITGRTMSVHGQPYTIVGVAAAGFTSLVPMLQPDFWMPLTWVQDVEPAGIQDVVPSPTGTTRLDRRGQRWLFVKARLKDGESWQRAEANLQAIMTQLAQAHPKTNAQRPISVAPNVRVHPEADRMVGPIAAGLMAAVGLVLLVACANVANMLLARASARRREIAVRIAIGASRGRLVRQLLTEGTVLGILGGAAGAALARLLLAVVELIPLPLPVPIALSLRIDWRVLLFTLAIAVGAGIAAAVAPALRFTRPGVTGDLRGEASAIRAGRRRLTLRDGLVALQIAFTLVLLVAADLLVRSVQQARTLELGFRSNGIAVLSTELGLIGHTPERATALVEQAMERVRALPGVASVGRATRQPLSINFSRQSVFFPDRQQPGERAHIVSAASVDETYFDTLEIPLLRGRRFTSTDLPSSARVAIVNSTFVRMFWPENEDAIGRRFRLLGIDGPEFEVVGIVGDYKVESIGERPRPYVHFPIVGRAMTNHVLIARGSGDAGALLSAIKREMLAIEPNALFIEAVTMEGQVDTSLLPARLAAQTAAVVGIVATILAAGGVFGVIAFTVARRTREIGIRVALGAAPGGVVALVMRQGLALAAVGIVLGLLLAVPAARAIASALYGVSAWDPIAWTSASAMLLCAAALANFIPARRASRIAPSIALRSE